MTTKVVDPRVADTEPADSAGVSVLALVEADIARQQEKRLRTHPRERVDVPGRPGWQFDFTTHLGHVDAATVEAEASQPDLPGGVDVVGKGINLAVRLCRGFVFNGVEVKDEAGQPVTFTSPTLHRLVGADNARDAVAKVWVDETGGMDEASLAYLGQELLIATGWAAAGRPTKRR